MDHQRNYVLDACIERHRAFYFLLLSLKNSFEDPVVLDHFTKNFDRNFFIQTRRNQMKEIVLVILLKFSTKCEKEEGLDILLKCLGELNLLHSCVCDINLLLELGLFLSTFFCKYSHISENGRIVHSHEDQDTSTYDDFQI